MKQTKTGKAIVWTVGIGIYVVGRIVLLNFLKTFAFLGIAISLHFSNALQAADEIKSPSFVFDDEEIINEAAFNATQKMLKEFAAKKRGAIQVIVINDDSRENLHTLALQKIDNLKRNHPQLPSSQKKAYWVIHAKRRESIFILPPKAAQDTLLVSRLSRVEQLVINPYLQQNEINRALTEGSVALTTILLV